jgi:hypothetical protein
MTHVLLKTRALYIVVVAALVFAGPEHSKDPQAATPSG